MKHRLAVASVIALMAAAPAWGQTSGGTTTQGTTTAGTTNSSGQTSSSNPSSSSRKLKPSQMSGSSTAQRQQRGNAATDAQTRQLNEQELSRLTPTQ